MSMLATLLIFAGCSEDEDPNAGLQQQLDEQIIEIEDYLSANAIDAEEVNGYYLEGLTQNPDGEAPGTGDAVGIYYEIQSLDGQVIDELEEGADTEPATFPFRQDRVLLPVALYDIISNMREGEEVRAYLPFTNAYQGFSAGDDMPAYSAAIIRVKLAVVRSEAEQRLYEDARIKAYLEEEGFAVYGDSLSGGVFYNQTQAGDTATSVGSNSTVQVRYRGSFLDGTEFDSNTDAGDQPLSVRIGQGSVISGFESAIRQMNLNEEGFVLIPSHEAYGSGYFTAPYELMSNLASQSFVSPTFAVIGPYSILRFDLEVEAIN